ncbi:MAG: aminopeptidase, partial [Bacteroidota bacterium]
RQFAIDSLGINDSENYRSVYDQQGEPILWVVTACDPYSLDRHYWHYPFLGKLGYMGAFQALQGRSGTAAAAPEGF